MKTLAVSCVIGIAIILLGVLIYSSEDGKSAEVAEKKYGRLDLITVETKKLSFRGAGLFITVVKDKDTEYLIFWTGEGGVTINIPTAPTE